MIIVIVVVIVIVIVVVILIGFGMVMGVWGMSKSWPRVGTYARRLRYFRLPDIAHKMFF